MPPSFLNSQSPLLLNTAGFLTLMPLVFGIIGTISPSTSLKLFGFHKSVSSSPSERKTAENLMLFHTSRDLFMATTNFAAYWYGDKKVLGWIFFAGCGVAIYDGVISQRQIGKDAWKHVGWVPIIGTLGAALLGWFD